MKIWTDDEYIEVDSNDVGELEFAMLFKAEHIKATADPELFAAVAYMLSRLWDTATKRVDVVRCFECVLHGNCVTEDAFVLAGIETPFCCAGKRKEGAD